MGSGSLLSFRRPYVSASPYDRDCRACLDPALGAATGRGGVTPSTWQTGDGRPHFLWKNIHRRVAAAYRISPTLCLVGEDSATRADLIFDYRTGRVHWALSHLAIAVVATAILVLACGLGENLPTQPRVLTGVFSAQTYWPRGPAAGRVGACRGLLDLQLQGGGHVQKRVDAARSGLLGTNRTPYWHR